MKGIISVATILSIIGMTAVVNSAGDGSLLSREAQEACVEVGEAYNIAPEFLMAIIEAESCGDPLAENGSCKGLMQISVKWHRDRMDRLGVTDIFDERSNILVGADYLAELFEKYQDPALVLDIYNGNRKAQENYERGILSGYAKKVLDRSEELEEGGIG